MEIIMYGRNVVRHQILGIEMMDGRDRMEVEVDREVVERGLVQDLVVPNVR